MSIQVYKALLRRKQTCVFVESCTGGLCSAVLTEIPGSSEVFWGGWTVYSNEAKLRLCVSGNTVEKCGAVSKQTVLELAKHGREKSGADWCASVSGIAGPSGGLPEKPVGTVWMGIAGEEGLWAYRFLLKGDRAAVREQAAARAFFLLLKHIESDRS